MTAAPQPRFTVLIATYNHAAFIRESLDSVLAQTDADWELVIVDDGSTDETRRVIGDWQRTSGIPQRVEVVTLANAGQSAAFETGFALCRGSLIALLDSDDRWLPGKLAAVRQAFEARPDAALLTHSQYIIDREGRRSGKLWPRAGLVDGDLRERIRRTGRLAVGTASTLVIPAPIFRSLLPMATRGFRSAADYYLSFGAALAGPVIALTEPLGEYRVHPEGQYLIRMKDTAGLLKQKALQETIIGHFGLAETLTHNAYYQRTRFALACLDGSLGQRWDAYRALTEAIVADPYLGAAQKLQQILFWAVAGCLPKPLFTRMWQWFLHR